MIPRFLHSMLLAHLMLACTAGWLGASTTVSLGSYSIQQNTDGDVRVSVTGSVELAELIVVVELDTSSVSFVPGSFWVSPTRLVNVYNGALVPVASDFLQVEVGDTQIRFWLHLSAEIGDSGWRIVPDSGTAAAAVFGFSLRGDTRALTSLDFGPGTPYAQYIRLNPYSWVVEPVTATPGSVLVYLPPEPVSIDPAGGNFNAAVDVTLASPYAIRIVYTNDGTDPGPDSLEYSTPVNLLGSDGETIVLKALALGEAGTSASGEAAFRFDMTAPTVTVTPLVTSARRPLVTGTVNETSASIDVSVSGGTYAGTNHGDGSWSLDLAGVLGEDLAEGVHDVGASATDPAGNVGTDVTVGELVIDVTPPTGVFSIGAGDPAYSKTRSVTLSSAVNGAVDMRFRNAADDFNPLPGEWTPWAPWVSSVLFTLAAGDTEKGVDAEFRDQALNVLALQDVITLDTVKPSSVVTTTGGYGPLTWPGEVRGTASDALSGVVQVALRCSRADSGAFWDGLNWVSEETWAVASGTTSWGLALPETDLPEAVTLTVVSVSRDAAGNEQALGAGTTLHYDSTSPSGTFAIAGAGVVAVPAASVSLVSEVTGAVRMRFRNAGGSWSIWQPYESTHTWSLATGDGAKTVDAEYQDEVGNGLALTDSVLLDTVAPLTTVVTAGGYGPSSWPGSVAGTAVDSTSGLAAVSVSIRRLPVAKSSPEYWDGSAWSATEQSIDAVLMGTAWSVSLPVADLLTGGDGRNYTVAATATDVAGNVETPAAESSFLFDSRIPSGGFTIGAGDPGYIKTQTVALYCDVVSSEHALEMRFRQEGEVFPSTWIPYAAVAPEVVLPSGNGSKRVYGEFRDMVSGNMLGTSDSVVLDLNAPDSTLLTTGYFGPGTWPGMISGTSVDVGPSGVAVVTVTVSRDDGQNWNGSGWQGTPVSVDAWPVAGSWALSLSVDHLTDAATYFVTSQAVDRAGNMQAIAAQTIINYDASAPGGTFAIGAGGPASTNTREVTLQIAVSGGVDMAFRNEGGAWDDWQALAGSAAWTLTGGEGTKKVFGRFRDAVGNVLEIFDTVVLDTTPPTCGVDLASAYGPVSWPGGLTGSATDALSTVEQVEGRIRRVSDGHFWDGAAWVVADTWLLATGIGPWSLAVGTGAFSNGESYAVSCRAVDGAGNGQTGTLPESTFLYDAVKPVSTILTPAIAGPVTWPGSVTCTGTDALTGVAQVEVAVLRFLADEFSYWDGAAWQAGFQPPWLVTTADGSSWSLPLLAGSLDHGGKYTVSARATDGVGNVQSTLTVKAFVYDSVAPAQPVLQTITDDTGLAGDWVTYDPSLLLLGQAEAEARVDLVLDDAVLGSVNAGVDGVWSYDHRAVVLADGAHALRVTATDAAGNQSAAADPQVITIDTVAPVVAITSPLAGTAVNGTEVLVFADDDAHGPLASVNGTAWSVVLSGVTPLASITGFEGLAQGEFALQLRDDDLAGNSGHAAVVLNKDTVAPAGYAITIGSDRIYSGNVTQLHFSLTGAEPGTLCSYRIGTAARTVLEGSFAVNAAVITSPAIDGTSLDDGVVTVAAWLTDATGNVGGEVSAEVSKDTVAPAGYAIAFESAWVNAESQSAVTLAVSAGELGASYHVSIQSGGGGPLVSLAGVCPDVDHTVGPADVSGLGDGLLTAILQVTDTFGNVGSVQAGSVRKDTLSPALPTVVVTTDPIHGGNATSFGFNGTTEAQATVEYVISSSAGGELIQGTTVVAGNGTYGQAGLDVTGLDDGLLTLAVRVKDPAGNVSAWTAAPTVLKDTVVPTGYSVTFDQAWVNAEVQRVATLTVHGGELGVVYDITVQSSGGGPAVIVNGILPDATLQIGPVDLSALGDGLLTAVLQLTDAAGNAGLEQADSVNKDVALPPVPTLVVTTDPIHAANVAAFAFGGTAEPLTWVDYAISSSAGGGPIESASTVGADGSYGEAAVDLSGLGDGLLTLAVRGRDAADNVSAWTTAPTVVKDTGVPSAPHLTSVNTPVALATVGQFGFTGTSEAVAYIDYRVVDGGAASVSGTISADLDGVFVAADVDVSPLADGLLTLTLTARDDVGNVSDETVDDSILKDTVLPGLTVDLPMATSRVDGSELLFYTADEPVIAQVSLDGTAWVVLTSGTTSVGDIDGFAALADGPFSLTVHVEDVAHNPASVLVDLYKDTTAPAGYAVAFTEAFVDGSETGIASFVISDAESGSAYSYEICDAAVPAATVSGTGLVGPGAETSVDADVSSLGTGTLTLTLRVTDTVGNVGDEVTATTQKGTTLVFAMRRGWNVLGVTVHPIDTVGDVLATAASHPDGALTRGALHGYSGGMRTELLAGDTFVFAHAYRVFAERPGALRVRGIPGTGLGTMPSGWTFACPGTPMLASDMAAPGSAWVETDQRVPGARVRLRPEAMVGAGQAVWIHRE